MSKNSTDNKKAFEAGSLAGFRLNPDDDVMLPGVDEYGPEHPMYQADTIEYLEAVRAGAHEADIEDVIMNGVIMTIEVVKDPRSGKAIPVDGRKRTIWAREANRRLAEFGKPPITIKAVLVPKGTKQVEAMLRTISANTHRYQLNALELMENAAHFIKLNGDDEATMKSLCVSLGIARSRLDKLLALREASPALHKGIKNGDLGVEAAIALAMLPSEEQAQQLETLKASAIKSGAKGGRVTADAARRSASGRAARPKASLVKGVVKALDKRFHVTDDNKKLLLWAIGEIETAKLPKAIRDLVEEMQAKRRQKAIKAKAVAAKK